MTAIAGLELMVLAAVLCALVLQQRPLPRPLDPPIVIDCLPPRGRLPQRDPLREVTPPPRYGPAPRLVPQPDGNAPDGARYGSFRPAPQQG